MSANNYQEHSNRDCGNKEKLASFGILPTTSGVQYYPNTETWIIRMDDMPFVDFYASKNKWKDVTTGEFMYGDAISLMQYLCRILFCDRQKED